MMIPLGKRENGHESHVMPDGSEHDVKDCPENCTISEGLRRILRGLESGELVIRRSR